jgi:K+/H+ antiporter YhaU regulatory subunit KhtT
MNPVIGKSLAELPWRHEKGISVIAIRRGDQMLLNPGGDTSIENGDVAIIVGSTENVRKFIRESGS